MCSVYRQELASKVNKTMNVEFIDRNWQQKFTIPCMCLVYRQEVAVKDYKTMNMLS